MFPIILLLSLLLLIFITRDLLTKANIYRNLIQATLLAVVIWGLWLVIFTETLSLIHQITFYYVLSGWVIMTAMLAGYAYFLPRPQLNLRWPAWVLPLNNRVLAHLQATLIFIMLMSGVIALISPPNNWDSMTYHLTRVMHWLQNHTLQPYTTHELRQLYQNPFAEMVILHLILLKGDDQFVNLVQWFSMVGSLFGTYWIAQQLHANFTTATLASLITSTIPMGILQSVTTQNDYLFSFWFVCFVSFILATQDNPHWLNKLGVAGSLALAILTKGTSYILIFPFLIWLIILLFKRNTSKAIRTVIFIGLVVLTINLGHYQRNLAVFNSPIKPAANPYSHDEYSNEEMSPTLLISNIVRNLSLHLSTPSQTINGFLQDSVKSFHNLLQVDINDPKTTWVATPFTIAKFNIFEDASGNLVHLILIGFTWLWVIRQRNSTHLIYMACISSSFLLFAFVLKWQLWHSRLHLPLFVVSTPLMALWLAEIQAKKLQNFIIILLVTQALPFLLINPSHPVVTTRNIFNQPRLGQYFIPRPMLEKSYLEIAQATQSCSQIGLVAPYDTWEYPFWLLLPKTADFHLEAIDVNNMTQILTDSSFEPCAIICLECSLEQQRNYAKQYSRKLTIPLTDQKEVPIYLQTVDGRK